MPGVAFGTWRIHNSAPKPATQLCWSARLLGMQQCTNTCPSTRLFNLRTVSHLFLNTCPSTLLSALIALHGGLQVPVLFTGTMRGNLDPFEDYNDSEVWRALRRANLAGLVENAPAGLDMQLSAGGAPLSAGQKQLVALARALLKRSKVCPTDYHISTLHA